MGKVMSMMPGMSGMADMVNEVDAEKDMQRLSGVIDSMTPEERRNPKRVIDQSRRRRIAAGAGVEPHEVNELVKQFGAISDIMQRMSNMWMRDRMPAMQDLGKGGMLDPGGRLARQKKGTGKRLSPKERAKAKKLRDKEVRRRKREVRSAKG